MAKTVKMCDMTGCIAGRVFAMLNEGVHFLEGHGEKVIFTDVEPKKLVYPEGWYYAKGSFRNKYNSTTGTYDEIPMETTSGDNCGDIAKYCTQD